MKRIPRAVFAFAGVASLCALTSTASAQEAPAAPPPPPPTGEAAPATPVPPGPDATKKAEKAVEEESPFPTYRLGVDAVFGWASPTDIPYSPQTTIPYALTSQEKSMMSFVLAAEARTSKAFAISAAFPITTAKFAEGLDGESASTVGNLEIAPKYFISLAKQLEMKLQFGLDLPFASGDRFAADLPTVRKEFANLAADRSRGLEESELFAAHRVGFVPKIGVGYDDGALELGAYTKIAFLQHLNGVFPPDNVSQNATIINWVTEIHGYYGFAEKAFSIGLRLWNASNLVDNIDEQPGAATPKHTQFTLEPQLKSELGPARIGVGYLLPLGGPDHDQKYGSVRVNLGAQF